MSRLSDEWHSDSDSDAFFPVRRCSAFCASLCSATRILCTCKSYGAVFFLHQILHISSIHWYRWCWTIRCDTIKTKVYTVLDVFWFLDVYLLSVVACIMSVVGTDPQNSILHKAQMTSSAQSPGHRISLQWHPSYENLICHGNLLRIFVSEKALRIYYTWYTCVILYSCRLWNSYMLCTACWLWTQLRYDTGPYILIITSENSWNLASQGGHRTKSRTTSQWRFAHCLGAFSYLCRPGTTASHYTQITKAYERCLLNCLVSALSLAWLEIVS